MRWTEAVNLGGSIASISGVSLLWLRTLAPEVQLQNLLSGFIASLVGALLSVGLCALALELLAAGAQWLAVAATPRQRTIYWSFASAAAIVVVGMVLLLIWMGVYIAWVIK
jgi:hypothetical protein